MRGPTLALIGALSLSAGGCGVHHGARPLDPGQHRVSATLGGPIVAFGGAYVPLPNLVVQGASGLPTLGGRPLELDYGLNVTALGFGLVGVDVGASHLLLTQSGGRPALAVSERIFLYSNHLSPDVEPDARGLSAIDQLELTASWDLGQQLLYAGVGEYLDFRNPGLLLSPFVGVDLSHGGGPWSAQVEVRYLALNRVTEVDTINWAGIGDRGALGLTFGLGRSFGETP